MKKEIYAKSDEWFKKLRSWLTKLAEMNKNNTQKRYITKSDNSARLFLGIPLPADTGRKLNVKTFRRLT